MAGSKAERMTECVTQALTDCMPERKAERMALRIDVCMTERGAGRKFEVAHF